MRHDKTFDCVRMKNEIQEKLFAERQGMSDAQVIEKIKEDLKSSDSSLAAWWRRIQHKDASVSRTPAAAH